MPFAFNFSVENDDGTESKENKAVNNGISGIGIKRDDERHITWLKAKEQFMQEFHLDRITSMLSIEHYNIGGRSVLNFVNSESVSKDMESRNYSGDLTPALTDSTDLVSGVYEGGLKIWECSEDLLEFLHSSKSGKLAGLKVMELGCGAALPGIYCFKEGASVWFNDYNEDVINEVTIPNMLLNVPEEASETRFFSGDWGDFGNILEKELKKEEDKFDLILTSETIYNIENQDKLVNIFRNFTKIGGEILVAAKTFYFGVGGGVRQFEELLKRSGLRVQTAKKYEDGLKREILQITL